MTFEIGQLTYQTPQPAGSLPRVTPSPGGADDRAVGMAEPQSQHDVLSDIIPASPPPDVLAEVDAAWERAAQLHAQGRELHFSAEKGTGRVIIQVRTVAGELLRTIPPSRALDIMSGGEL